jgi:hypothetical protein
VPRLEPLEDRAVPSFLPLVSDQTEAGTMAPVIWELLELPFKGKRGVGYGS